MQVATRLVTSKLADLYSLMDSSPMFISDDGLRQMREVVDDFGAAYQRLRAWARDKHFLRWQVRPKVHKAMHIPDQAAIINPKFENCYIDESLIGSSQKVWKASVHGKYASYVHRTSLAKRWLSIILRLERDIV